MCIFSSHYLQNMEVEKKFSNPIQQELMGDLIILMHFVPTGLETFCSISTWLSHRLTLGLPLHR